MSTQIYCVKQRKYTDTKDLQARQTANGRYQLIGSCVECGSKKSKLVSKAEVEKLQQGGAIPAIIGMLAAPAIGALVSSIADKFLGNSTKGEGVKKKE
jgi:hypothetical protein